METSTVIVKDGKREMQEIHDLMVKYDERSRELDLLVKENHGNTSILEGELEELTSRELLLKDTLGQLIKRREKVRVIYTGIDGHVKNQ